MYKNLVDDGFGNTEHSYIYNKNEKINKKTKAIIITHIYGFPVDMDKIIKTAKKKNIFIV